MSDALLATLLVVNQILNAGNTITAFSLLLYALTFNLRERVARAFALLLACVTLAYFFDSLTATSSAAGERELWLRLQWLGISFVPAIYLHLTDALLETTGRPSRGRRRSLVWLSYGISTVFFALAGTTRLVGGELRVAGDAVYLGRGALFYGFVLYLLGSLSLAGLNFYRAYLRGLTSASRRRMIYLIVGSIGPLLGSFPFLMLFGGFISTSLPHLFWSVLVFINAAVAGMMVLMAYAVAYFGVSHPDRVVKSRLFQWILRGPVVASSVLAVTIVTNRFTAILGIEHSRAGSFVMVGSLLLLQYLITIFRIPFERWLFYGDDRHDVARLHLLQDRLLTTSDLRQFLESVLNAACDVIGVTSAFLAVIGESGLELEVAVGPDDPFSEANELPPLMLGDAHHEFAQLGTVFSWDVYWLLPLQIGNDGEVRGVLGIFARAAEPDFSSDEQEALKLLASRAADALTDRVLQKEVFSVVDRLATQVDVVQRMRAAARYAGVGALTADDALYDEGNLVDQVKDALGHFWGGPNLTRSPLLRLRVVTEARDSHDGNPVNALRTILRRAIEQVRPEGERRVTAEWMLYNILEMKFVQGRKVRDIAMRLAMSEADLYRKQRVAIEAVARAMADMERQATSRSNDHSADYES